jgi:transposase
MEHGAIDLHKKESQVRILTESGEVIDQRIRTTRDRLTALFWGRPHARILIEASTESEWVAQHLETLGHEVIVADPNYGLMYGHRSRRVKPIVAMSRPSPKPVAMGFIDARIVGRRASGWSSGT